MGTRKGFIGKFFGDVIGSGSRIRIREAVEALEKHFGAGDRTVDIIGFSRGAALALHFANEVKEKIPDAKVRFLGLWVVVASFGLPGNDINIDWHLSLPESVQKCCHAMALDERRENFKPMRAKMPGGDTPTEGRL